MGGDGSDAGSGGESGGSDDWSSPLRDVVPVDVEEVTLCLTLRRSRLDQGSSGSSCSAMLVARRRSVGDIPGPSCPSHSSGRSMPVQVLHPPPPMRIQSSLGPRARASAGAHEDARIGVTGSSPRVVAGEVLAARRWITGPHSSCRSSAALSRRWRWMRASSTARMPRRSGSPSRCWSARRTRRQRQMRM
jgi:hypothetical protein